MNPVSDDSLDWLAGLGLLVIEEGPDGTARSLAQGGTGVSNDVATALAHATGLPPGDPRIATVVRHARSTGAALVELAGARVAVSRRADRTLRAVIVPLDRTAAGVVHELANALTGIAGWAQLAARAGPMPERTRNALEVLDRASSDALDTARTLLASLRGRADVGAGCDVADVVGAAIATLRPLADDKNIVLRAELPAGLAVGARAAELRSIATNLIKNAIEALDPGGEIVIAAQLQTDAIALTVVDDGPGMDAATLARVFDPWVSSKTGGAGLGLALVRDLARARGGDVSAESGRGRGARFVVRLPALAATSGRGARERRGTARSSGVRRRSTSSLRRPMRVLVVDDDESLRNMVCTALELRGAVVVTARGVQDATAPSERFDLALVDLTLRDGTGDQLVDWLVEHDRARRIVLMSGSSAVPAELDGVTAVLRKPFTLDDLAELVDRMSPDPKSARARGAR
jgi:signal transduction histidine kinase/ActR/RegA family two-component response regulator